MMAHQRHRRTLTRSGGAERPPTADGATEPRRTAVPPSAAVGVRRDLLEGLVTRSRRSSENRPCYEWQGYAQAASAVRITIVSSSIISEATVVARWLIALGHLTAIALQSYGRPPPTSRSTSDLVISTHFGFPNTSPGREGKTSKVT